MTLKRPAQEFDKIKVHVYYDEDQTFLYTAIDLHVEDAEADPVPLRLLDNEVRFLTDGWAYIAFDVEGLEALAYLGELGGLLHDALKDTTTDDQDEQIVSDVRRVFIEHQPDTYSALWMEEPGLIEIRIVRDPLGGDPNDAPDF